MSDFSEHCRKIAQGFLLTAIVVDDELSLSKLTEPHDHLIEPNSSTDTSEENLGDQPPLRTLNVDQITASFLRYNIVCGVVSPQEGDDDALAKALSRADITILDWRLGQGKTAFPLLEQILSEGHQNQLRLIAIYTGESNADEILKEIKKIKEHLNGSPENDSNASADTQLHMIDFGACRIVLYFKDRTPSASPERVVSEEDLPDRLIDDFARMIEGILPSVVVVALTSVRENIFRVLERFGSDLDPAFLTHRVCLPQPQESEQHIVEQIASELHGIMEDTIIKSSPAGIKVIKHWLSDRFGEDNVTFGNTANFSVDQVLNMLDRGLEEKDNRVLNPSKKLNDLSQGFSGKIESNKTLDLRLASVMSFRQVLDQKQRQLTMGTVIQFAESSCEEFLICITPKCDSVRLVGQTSFLFTLLTEPKSSTVQIVVPVNDHDFRRMSISMKPSDWRIMDFMPDPEQECVLSYLENHDPVFTFQTANKEKRYRWVGELKPEFSQSIAQRIAGRMSRVPLNKSEWLRRSEKKG